MTHVPKPKPPVSSTCEKATELELPAPTQSVVVPAPATPRALRPPPPPPSSRPSLPPSSRSSVPSLPLPRKTQHPTEPTSKATIALGDSDLEPLSSLGAKPTFSIRRGAVLGGRFRVKELIGAGAQCYVFSAEHTTLKSAVAIKCLQPQLVTPDLVDRFAREAQALTAIRNAHVAAVLDVGRAPCGTPFIVMEFLEGRDLGALLETRPRLEQRQATEILLQTCEGLAAAHALGLVHQDIKPSNIFLSDEMGIVKAKVVDFGVARVAIARTPSLPPKFTRSELDDTVGGTPFYMPPEQFFANSVIDPRSDIFSLGMVLYEMLRGTHAFDLEMSTRQPGQRVRLERAGIDPGLFSVIERCLMQDPEARFESVAELAVAILPFAPSRSRSHAEAAAALLRKAGLSVASRMPSSFPPPPMIRSQPLASAVPPLPPAILPSISSVPVPVPAPASRWPLYVGIAIAVGAVGAAAAWRSFASREVAAAPTATNALPTTGAQSASGPSPIVINPVVRPAPLSSSADVETVPGSTPAARPAASALDVKAAKAAKATKAAAGEGQGAKALDPPSAKPPGAATGTSEDLGF